MPCRQQVAVLDELHDEMHAAGLDDLVTIVVNQRLESDIEGIALLEGYVLPVLQDSEEDDVYGSWEGTGYDAFVVAREGHIEWTINDAHPAEQYGGFVAILTSYIE